MPPLTFLQSERGRPASSNAGAFRNGSFREQAFYLHHASSSSRSAKLSMTANSERDSGDSGALPGRLTTMVYSPAWVAAAASADYAVS